jgi:hypothetical protein
MALERPGPNAPGRAMGRFALRWQLIPILSVDFKLRQVSCCFFFVIQIQVRVDLGGRPFGSTTDPDVPVKGIRLVTLWHCPSTRSDGIR